MTLAALVKVFDFGLMEKFIPLFHQGLRVLIDLGYSRCTGLMKAFGLAMSSPAVIL